MSELAPSQASGKTFFGHPRQLSTLFHIELWERFSFYGMQGILFIYLYYSATKGASASARRPRAASSALTAAAFTSPPSSAAGLPTAFLARNAPCSTLVSSS